MRKTTQHLFTGSPLSEHLARNFGTLTRDVNGCDTLAELLELESYGTDPYLVKPVQLQRDLAEFSVDEVSRGIEAKIKVPFKGDGALLHHKPDGLPNPGLYGSTYESDDPVAPSGWVSFSETFDRATPDEVRAWAKKQVDNLESVLAKQESQIDEHNAAVPGESGRLLEKRRGALSDAEELRRGLGKGI